MTFLVYSDPSKTVYSDPYKMVGRITINQERHWRSSFLFMYSDCYLMNSLVRYGNYKQFNKHIDLENLFNRGKNQNFMKKRLKKWTSEFLDPFWGFKWKKVLGIHDPRISWLLFGTKNHQMRDLLYLHFSLVSVLWKYL